MFSTWALHYTTMQRHFMVVLPLKIIFTWTVIAQFSISLALTMIGMTTCGPMAKGSFFACRRFTPEQSSLYLYMLGYVKVRWPTQMSANCEGMTGLKDQVCARRVWIPCLVQTGDPYSCRKHDWRCRGIAFDVMLITFRSWGLIIRWDPLHLR